jgi:hypothetical protein
MMSGSPGPAIESDLIPPPPERAQHDRIERLDRQINDARGDIGVPWQAVGYLGKLLAEGRINEAEFEAGRRFRADFRAAHLEGLHASDLSRPRIDSGHRAGELAAAVVGARRRVMAALDALGGIASPAGSVIWACVGEEATIKAWAQSRYLDRPMSPHQGSGALIAALGCLATFYRVGRA